MITKAEEPDGNVTQKLEKGDPKLLGSLRRMVVAIHGRSDTDLEQEVFLKVFEAFRRQKEIRAPMGLMRKIARDTVVDSWRKRHRALRPDTEARAGLQCPDIPHPEAVIDSERNRERLRESILDLGRDIRGPVYLFYIENYPIHSIVRIFGKSPSAVKMALHRGRRQLKQRLANR